MPTVLYAALINWFVTTMFVESKLFEPVRTFVQTEAWYVKWVDGKWRKCAGRHGPLYFPDDFEGPPEIVMRGPWLKLSQLVTCQMCMRTWVGFALALYLGGPLGGWAAPVANGLLYAAGGHLILELRSRVALVVAPLPADPE